MALCLIEACFCGAVGAQYAWEVLDIRDTLELWVGGQKVGKLLGITDVLKKEKTVRQKTYVEVNTGDGEQGPANFMKISEIRNFDYSGNLKDATQKMESPSGKNEWRLAKSNDGAWRLTISVGSTKTEKPVDTPADNLRAVYEIYSGIKAGTLKPGMEWTYSSFEFLSAQPLVMKTTCTEIATPDNGHLWTFITRDNVTQRDEKWVIDRNLRTLYHDISGMFVAMVPGYGDPSGHDSTPRIVNGDFTELFKVPARREAKPGEMICVEPDSAVTLHGSVGHLYSPRGTGWCLLNQQRSCTSFPLGAMPDSLAVWLNPTITIQSNAREIVRLAEKIKGTETDCCVIVERANAHVFRTIKKRNTAAFSSALETLKAGFGDCGEHAVLLAALLRAAGIPARVVLGLVYLDSKKGYCGHAWVTAYTGEWIFVDPALGTFPAPDHRVPLIIDDTGEDALQLAKVLGRLRISYVPAQ
jgi:hypothetical protein